MSDPNNPAETPPGPAPAPDPPPGTEADTRDAAMVESLNRARKSWGEANALEAAAVKKAGEGAPTHGPIETRALEAGVILEKARDTARDGDRRVQMSLAQSLIRIAGALERSQEAAHLISGPDGIVRAIQMMPMGVLLAVTEAQEAAMAAASAAAQPVAVPIVPTASSEVAGPLGLAVGSVLTREVVNEAASLAWKDFKAQNRPAEEGASIKAAHVEALMAVDVFDGLTTKSTERREA